MEAFVWSGDMDLAGVADGVLSVVEGEEREVVCEAIMVKVPWGRKGRAREREVKLSRGVAGVAWWLR